jgi:hypothetical protein
MRYIELVGAERERGKAQGPFGARRRLRSVATSSGCLFVVLPVESIHVLRTFIEHFPSGGFDNTSYPPAGLSSPNITSTPPLMPILSSQLESSWSTGVSQLLDNLS